MNKGNVLLLGNSGVGKSTLINTILNESAETGFGNEGTTKSLKVYENEAVPFRIIDTIGFEPSQIFKKNKAISEVQKWSKEAALSDGKEEIINLICFCVDGTSSKLFQKTIQDFIKATSIWKNVPILVVITKSYSDYDKEKNVEMVKGAFKNSNVNFKGIFPVVAKPYMINDDTIVPPSGIENLIEAINEYMPEGIKAAQTDVNTYILNRKRVMAQSTIAACTTAGVGVGLVPIPIQDALLLGPIEAAEIKMLAKIYGMKSKDGFNNFLQTIVEVGTVSIGAKLVISALKAVPGINLAASVINGIVAGAFVSAIGESSVYMMEQDFLGNNSIANVEWVRKMVEERLSEGFVEKVTNVLKELPANPTKEDLTKAMSGFSTKLAK